MWQNDALTKPLKDTSLVLPGFQGPAVVPLVGEPFLWGGWGRVILLEQPPAVAAAQDLQAPHLPFSLAGHKVMGTFGFKED